jgi:site-specific recombinase XerC
VREYARNVRVYCAWLAETPDRAGWHGDPAERSARARSRRAGLPALVAGRAARAASTVNLALASLDALYRCLGLGRPHVRRDKSALAAAPRALDEAAQRRLLRAADNAPVRSRALVVLMLFTTLRISGTVALDADDVRILTRKGVLVVLGIGEVQRGLAERARASGPRRVARAGQGRRGRERASVVRESRRRPAAGALGGPRCAVGCRRRARRPRRPSDHDRLHRR